LTHVVKAAECLSTHPGIEFHLYGWGSCKDELSAMVRDLRLKNITFHDPVPKNMVPDVLCAADILLLNYARIGIGKYGISPNKLWEYMASGRPIVFAHEAANNPIAEFRCGLSVAPEDPECLADAIRTLATMDPADRQAMGGRGLNYVRAHHDWLLLAEQLDTLLGDVLQE